MSLRESARNISVLENNPNIGFVYCDNYLAVIVRIYTNSRKSG